MSTIYGQIFKIVTIITCKFDIDHFLYVVLIDLLIGSSLALVTLTIVTCNNCPIFHEQNGDWCYIYDFSWSSMVETIRECKKSDSEPVLPTSPKENQFVVDHVTRGQRAWLGLKRVHLSSKSSNNVITDTIEYVDLSGKNLNYTNWRNESNHWVGFNEPDCGATDNCCVYIDTDGTWSDIACDTHQKALSASIGGLCRKRARNATSLETAISPIGENSNSDSNSTKVATPSVVSYELGLELTDLKSGLELTHEDLNTIADKLRLQFDHDDVINNVTDLLAVQEFELRKSIVKLTKSLRIERDRLEWIEPISILSFISIVVGAAVIGYLLRVVRQLQSFAQSTRTMVSYRSDQTLPAEMQVLVH